MSYNYIKPRKYYEDNYDTATIEECLNICRHLNQGLEEKKHLSKYSGKEFQSKKELVISIAVNVFRTNRFKNRNEWIDKRMDEDLQQQTLLDNAKPDELIDCSKCASHLNVVSKDLMQDKYGTERVLFVYECSNKSCTDKCAYYDNGEEWEYEPVKCPNCKSPLTTQYIKSDPNLMIFRYICDNCDYKNDDIHDFKKLKEDDKKANNRQKKLLEKFKDSFCYSEEEGKQAILDVERVSRFQQQASEQLKKEADPIFKKVKELEILKINELKKLVESACIKIKFSSPTFQSPTIDKHVIIEFMVTDEDNDREELSSKQELSKSLKKILLRTNWRLMTTGISYNLGILKGYLKGYEREEDLYKLAKQL